MWLFWYFDNVLFFLSVLYSLTTTATVKGTFMQIEKLLINDCLCVLSVPWKFYILTIYSFVVIHPWNLLFSLKVAYNLTISIVFYGCKQSLCG